MTRATSIRHLFRRGVPVFLSFALVGSAVSGARSQTVVLPTNVSEQRLVTEMLWKDVRGMKPGARPRIVLVLGGGGARGLAHIGVLRVLEDEHIPVDQIVGVSVGALIGSLYASGISVNQIESMASDVGWNKLTDFSKVSLVKLILAEDLLSSDRMETYLRDHIGNRTFSDLNIPFSCVATDIRTGERVVFNEGPVAIAARASATFPAVFRPVEYRQRLLVDGGLVDNLPTDVVTVQNGWDLVIAVLPEYDATTVQRYTVFRSLLRSIDIQKSVISNEKRKTADVLIEPNVGDVGLADLNRSRDCIEAGTEAARAAALEIKAKVIERILSRASKKDLR